MRGGEEHIYISCKKKKKRENYQEKLKKYSHITQGKIQNITENLKGTEQIKNTSTS